MKRFIFYLTLFALTLTACQPVPSASEDAVVSVPGEGTRATPSDGASFSDSQGSIPTPSTSDPILQPSLSWDTGPGALIVSATFCCGFTTMETNISYIPDAQIWGDGRIAWVAYEKDRRQVYEGQLTPGQLEAVLQQITDAGFFGWDERYANNLVMDFADKCIVVNLKEASKSVCEYFEGAPEAFHALYDMLKTGAGASGVPFTPETGYLQAREIGKASENDQTALRWASKEMGFTLQESANGLWIEGASLEIVWDAVDAHPGGLVFQDGEMLYVLTLQIPGLSRMEPPAK